MAYITENHELTDYLLEACEHKGFHLHLNS